MTVAVSLNARQLQRIKDLLEKENDSNDQQLLNLIDRSHKDVETKIAQAVKETIDEMSINLKNNLYKLGAV